MFLVTLYTIIEANLIFFYKFHHSLLKKLEIFSKTSIYTINLDKKASNKFMRYDYRKKKH